MRVGVFTPLLSQMPLAAALKKLAALHIHTVELATGNYPGDAHCKLSMLDDAAALSDFKKGSRFMTPAAPGPAFPCGRAHTRWPTG